MNFLDWAISHGATVWQACLALFVAAGLAAAFLPPRVGARWAARRIRARLGAPADPASGLDAGTRVTLSGVLQAEGACERFEDGSPAAASSAVPGVGPSAAIARSPGLVLLAGETPIELRGPVDVLTGSREVRTGRSLRRLPVPVRMRVAEASGPEAPLVGEAALVFRSLAAGDRVRVTGVLAGEASDEGHSYRRAPKQWALTSGAEPALLAAAERAPRLRLPATRYLGRALAGAAVFVALAWGLGEWSLRFGVLRVGPAGGELLIDRTRSTFVALVTPFRRQDALRGIVASLDADRLPDPEVIERRIRIHELLGDPDVAARIRIGHGEPARGAEQAEALHEDELAGRGWYAVGDFARAGMAWDGRSNHDPSDLRFAIGSHLMAGGLGLAAEHARRLSIALLRPSGSMPASGHDRQSSEIAACLADALDARLGDPAAQTRVEAREARPIGRACATLVADLVPGEARLDLIHRLRMVDDSFDAPKRWLELLAADADPRRTEAPAPPAAGTLEVVASPGPASLPFSIPAIEQGLAETLAGERAPSPAFRRLRGRALESAAVFAAYAGDHAAARRFARLRVEDARALGWRDIWNDERLRAVLELEAIIAMLAGDREGARQISHVGIGPVALERLDLGADGLLNHLAHAPPANPDDRRAWAFVLEDKGARLASWLREPTSEPGLFLRLLPSVVAGTDELRRTLRYGYRMPEAFRPAEQLVHLENLAMAAERLGDVALAAELRERAQRFYRALLRRETAVPLAVLQWI